MVISNGISFGFTFQSVGIFNDKTPFVLALCAFTETVISLDCVPLKIITSGSILVVTSGKTVKGT